MSTTQPVLSNTQIAEITSYVNSYRALNRAPPLLWDNSILNFSNHWSYYLLANDLFQHSGTQLYGENLAYFEGYGLDPMNLMKKAIDSWYNEINSYNFNSPGFYDKTGHFTCLVWVSSTHFAMGISFDEKTSKAYIVFNTSPPGNVVGEFQQNVLSGSSLPSPPPPPSPSPSPSPSPLPYPSQQLTIQKIESINNVINELHNIIYSINSNQPKYFIIVSINKVISDVKMLNIATSISIINSLYGILNLIKKKNYYSFVITTINNIINNLLSILG